MWNYFDLNNRAYKTIEKKPNLHLELLEERQMMIEKPEQEKKEEINLSLEEMTKTIIKESKKRKKLPVYEMKEPKNTKIVPLSPVHLTHLSPIRQIFMYFGIFIGVFFSTAVSQFKSGESFNIIINVGTILISAIIALILIPIVYEKLNLNPSLPFIVQFGLFVQSGVFWHVIINSVSKII